MLKRHIYTDEEKANMNYVHISWNCICHRCGRHFIETSSHLSEHLKFRPNEASCGCKKHDMLINGEFHKIHGLSGTRLYNIFNGMKTRCYNPNYNKI